MDAAVESCFEKLKEWCSSESSLSLQNVRFCDDERNLRRYAVARNGDFPAALKQLKSSLVWRDELFSSPLHCPACDKDGGMHCFFPIGVSAPMPPQAVDGAIVVYACAARAKTNDTAVTVRHMVHSLETAWGADRADKLCWLIDFNGFGLSHAMGGGTASSFLSHISAHLPERLFAAVLINPPGIFDMLLAVLRPFIDARTMGKVHVVRTKPDKPLAPEFEKFGVVDKRQLEWLEAALSMTAVPGLQNLPPVGPLGDLAHLQLPHMASAFTREGDAVKESLDKDKICEHK